MRGWQFSLSILSIAAVFGWSCEDPNTLAVSKVFSNNNLETIYSDTFSVVTSTVQLDTFLTGNTGTVLLGRYHDNQLGTVSSSSYFQLSYSYPFQPTFQSYFDSMVLVLFYNKTFSGDTTQTLKLNGYQVLEDIIPRRVPIGSVQLSAFGNYNGFFSSTQFAHSSSPIFSKSVKLFPHRDTVTLRLPDSYGANWFRLAQIDSGNIFSRPDIFSYAFFKGLYVAPDPSSTASVAGFTTSKLRLRIYYRKLVNGLLRNTHYDFMVNGGFQFNNIQYDRSGTLLSSLQPNKSISTTLTNNTGYVQAGTGLVTRLDFPSVKSFFSNNHNVLLNAAYLTVSPEPGSFPLNLLPPSTLQLYATDQTNVPIVTFGGANAAIVYDNIYGINTHYLFTLYSYFFGQIKSSTNYITPVFITPGGSLGGNVQRVFIADRFQGYSRIKLQLYYTYVPN